MLAGHLQTKNGRYYAVLNCKHKNGKRFPKWITVGLTAQKGNKRAAIETLNALRHSYNKFGEPLTERQKTLMFLQAPSNGTEKELYNSMLFADYMLFWLSYKETEVDPGTFAGYCESVNHHIYPYFKKLGVTLSQLEPLHLKEFYRQERIGNPQLGKAAKKGSTVVRYHANIHDALETAIEDGLIGQNAAHRQRPTVDRFIGGFYTPEEAVECMRLATGTRLELAIYFGLFYGLRRSEIVGLQWKNFDFIRNTFTIAHTVTTFEKDGKKHIYAKDKAKNKSSLRTLPLIPIFLEKLLLLKEWQQENRTVYRNAYSKEYLEYVYVDELGMLMDPSYISSTFPKFLEKHGLRHIRFHDTRHSCASLLLQNGISMKEIQIWLGHSDYNTTANLYAHLDIDWSLQSSASRLSKSLFAEAK